MNCKTAAIWFTKSFPTLWTLLSRWFLFACMHMCAWVFVCSHGCGYMCVSQRLMLDVFLDCSSYCLSRQGLSLHLELCFCSGYPAHCRDSLFLCPGNGFIGGLPHPLSSTWVLGIWTSVLKLYSSNSAHGNLWFGSSPDCFFFSDLWSWHHS